MDVIKGVVLTLHSKRNEEDIVDRWNFHLTAYIFAFCTLIITSNTYMGKPITCWTPAEFRGGWDEYARDYCLIENTYFVPMDDPNLPNHYIRERDELPYYQWVQFVLVILAFFFFLPHLVWRSLNWWSGIQVKAIVNACCSLPVKEEDRSKKLDKIVGHIYRNAYITDRKDNPMFAGWVSLCYVLMKVLFILNIALQIVVLHLFLGFNWADLFSLNISFTSDWRNTGLFPRSTMCDFEIRIKGNVQRYSVQCVLSQNMFNEKIFLILFYWLWVLFVITVTNTTIWIRQIFDANSRRDYAERLLNSTDFDEATRNHKGQNISRSFTNLNRDLLVLLRLISSNAGDNVTSEVLIRLYKMALKAETESIDKKSS